ncbi:hypothetical protein C0995_014427 [Termitomyces sp. Mi166|nr:hypothetical protein C0995_014427 [Termitomyces sp. Mi166\
MSTEKKIELTDPLIAKLKECKANTKFGTHNVPLEVFGDATQSLQAIKKYMIALHACTGMEMLLACQSSTDMFLHPWMMCTSEHMTPGELAMHMEAYCLSGVEEEIIGGKVRMTYLGFEDRFTVPYGVLIEKWPLSRFCSPSELTRAEVNVLLGAWISSTTYFCKMSTDEWEKWREEHVQRLTALAKGSAGPSVPTPSPSSLNSTPSPSSANSSDGPTITFATEGPMEGVEDPTAQFQGTLVATMTLVDMTNTNTMPSATIFINSSGSGTAVRKQKQ